MELHKINRLRNSDDCWHSDGKEVQHQTGNNAQLVKEQYIQL